MLESLISSEEDSRRGHSDQQDGTNALVQIPPERFRRYGRRAAVRLLEGRRLEAGFERVEREDHEVDADSCEGAGLARWSVSMRSTHARVRALRAASIWEKVGR